MAVIKPFPGLRFTNSAQISSLVCPPYDIVSQKERQEYLAANPYNIIRLELPLEGGEERYAQAGQLLRQWLAEGVLAQDEQAAFYLYEEEFLIQGERKCIRGLVCRAMLYEMAENVVLPHEETLSKAKTDRFQLLQAAQCNFSSIYSLYFDQNKEIARLLDKIAQGQPETAFTDREGVVHRLWSCREPGLCADISRLMEEKKLYIADGHHRYETSLNYRRFLREQGVAVEGNHPANFILMTLVAMEDEGLVVLPTHRIVQGLEDFSAEQVLESCRGYFQVSPLSGGLLEIQASLEKEYTNCKKAFVLYEKQGAYLLSLKDTDCLEDLFPGKSAVYRQLDVSILHTLVLEKLLHIDRENLANQKNLVYTRSMEEAMEAVDRGQADCAFLINPTRVEEIAQVAANGEKMPQKSTYFYPKLITGLVMNLLEG